ncbi:MULTISPECIES: hypothetical protein [Comamonas]|uniref:hypothetical protein n=1 Tax=Comamonas TaxID=283 RepID=UPI0005A9D07F|nr:hypothetical protein [Comamonas aquatica]MDE1555842.1 hypothetical protein [Comamonas aquatica]
MYTALKHSHMLLAVLTLLLAVGFAALAWQATPARKSALVYVCTRIFGGLAALTGLAITFVGPWQQMMYPYIGLILYVVHGLAIGFAKRADSPAKLGQRRGLLAVQLLALLALTGLMGAKPF